MTLECALVLALLEVPQANASILTRRGHQIIEGMYHKFGNFGSMAQHGVLSGFPRETVTNGGFAAKRGKLAHTIAAFTLLIFFHLLGLLLQFHDLLF